MRHHIPLPRVDVGVDMYNGLLNAFKGLKEVLLIRCSQHCTSTWASVIRDELALYRVRRNHSQSVMRRKASLIPWPNFTRRLRHLLLLHPPYSQAWNTVHSPLHHIKSFIFSYSSCMCAPGNYPRDPLISLDDLNITHSSRLFI